MGVPQTTHKANLFSEYVGRQHTEQARTAVPAGWVWPDVVLLLSGLGCDPSVTDKQRLGLRMHAKPLYWLYVKGSNIVQLLYVCHVAEMV